jgi:hypothetical protein
MTSASPTAVLDRPRAGPAPLIEGRKPVAAVVAMWVFMLVPFAALTAAVPFAWGWGLSWTDLATTATAYVICGFGVPRGRCVLGASKPGTQILERSAYPRRTSRHRSDAGSKADADTRQWHFARLAA